MFLFGGIPTLRKPQGDWLSRELVPWRCQRLRIGELKYSPLPTCAALGVSPGTPRSVCFPPTLPSPFLPLSLLVLGMEPGPCLLRASKLLLQPVPFFHRFQPFRLNLMGMWKGQVPSSCSLEQSFGTVKPNHGCGKGQLTKGTIGSCLSLLPLLSVCRLQPRGTLGMVSLNHCSPRTKGWIWFPRQEVIS